MMFNKARIYSLREFCFESTARAGQNVHEVFDVATIGIAFVGLAIEGVDPTGAEVA